MSSVTNGDPLDPQQHPAVPAHLTPVAPQRQQHLLYHAGMAHSGCQRRTASLQSRQRLFARLMQAATHTTQAGRAGTAQQLLAAGCIVPQAHRGYQGAEARTSASVGRGPCAGGLCQQRYSHSKAGWLRGPARPAGRSPPSPAPPPTAEHAHAWTPPCEVCVLPRVQIQVPHLEDITDLRLCEEEPGSGGLAALAGAPASGKRTTAYIAWLRGGIACLYMKIV